MKTNEIIKKRRKELKLSLEDVARELGVNRSTVMRYETKGIEKLPIDIIPPLAKILKCTPEYLMGWEEQKENDISFDDFRFALYGEVKDLTEEQKQAILDFARFIKNK